MLVNVTDGTRIRLVVEGEPLDVRTGTVLEHERALDLRAGLLVRSLRWRSPGGHEVRLRTRRLVSLEHRELAAIEYEVEATGPLRLTVHSELTTEVAGPKGSADPRSGAGLPRGRARPAAGRPRWQPRAARARDAGQPTRRGRRHGPRSGRRATPRDDGPGRGIAGALVAEHHGGAGTAVAAGQAAGLPLGRRR